MNNIFKKDGEIHLGGEWWLIPDGFSGVQLQKRFLHEREKKDGTKEAVEKSEDWFFANISQALRKYAQEEQKSSKTLEDLIQKTDKILSVVEEFRTNYKNW